MKKKFLIIIALIAIAACNKPEEGKVTPTPGPTPTPTPTPTEQIVIPSSVDTKPVVSSEGGDTKISFTAAAAWTASVINTKADSWVDVNPKNGNAGSAEITIKTTANDTYAERNATIQIKCGTATKDIVLTQKQLDNITVTTDKVELGAEGGTFTIVLKSNIDYKYEISGDWIKESTTKAYTENTLTFSADPNDDVAKREGSVTIKGGKFTETVKVYQSGVEPSLVITQNEYNLEAGGGSIIVEVVSNVQVKMTIPEDVDWISENQTKSVSTSTFHLDVAANDTYESRSAEITFSNDESGLSEKITVNQKGKTFIHVTSVTLDCNELTLIEGETVTLTATVAPENATNKNVTWSSSDETVATVDQSGKVTAVKAGEATITVKTEDGSKTATCAVTVNPKVYPVTGVSLDKTTITLTEGDAQTLVATVAPENATNKNVTWSSSDETVATVDQSGKVTAVKAGEATITVKTEDGGKTATCKVTVKGAIEGINPGGSGADFNWGN